MYVLDITLPTVFSAIPPLIITVAIGARILVWLVQFAGYLWELLPFT
jgi:hypothetical protein